MKRENANYARTLNRRLKGWDDAGIESNQVKLTRQMLEDFYTKHDLEVGAEDKFATQLDLTPEQESEYEKIMDQFGRQAGTSINEMKSVYEEQKDMYEKSYDIKNFEEFITFTDKMKEALDDGLIKSILSSEEIADLYSEAHIKGVSYKVMDEKIVSAYYKSKGKTGEALVKAIDAYDAKMEPIKSKNKK